MDCPAQNRLSRKLQEQLGSVTVIPVRIMTVSARIIHLPRCNGCSECLINVQGTERAGLE